MIGSTSCDRLLGWGEEYFDLFGLTLAAGTFFTAQEMSAHEYAAVISESVALRVFGSVEAAIGERVTAPAMFAFRGGGGGGGSDRVRIGMPAMEIVGVYEDVTDFQREAYGIGEMIIPWYAALPEDVPRHILEGAANAIVYALVEEQTPASVEAAVRRLVEREYGDEAVVEVWEGTPRGDAETLQQIRDLTSAFERIVNMLGVVLLVSGSIGIFSIMMVDVVGRTREMALERALGASQRRIVGEFLTRSSVMAAISALAGVGIALLAAAPMHDLVVPLFRNGVPLEVPSMVVTARGVVVGVSATVGLGAVFGVIPIMSRVALPISDGLREV